MDASNKPFRLEIFDFGEPHTYLFLATCTHLLAVSHGPKAVRWTMDLHDLLCLLISMDFYGFLGILTHTHNGYLDPHGCVVSFTSVSQSFTTTAFEHWPEPKHLAFGYTLW
jgi:hypothetical protein